MFDVIEDKSRRVFDYVKGYDGNYSYIESKTPYQLIKEYLSTTSTFDSEFFSQSGFTILK